MNRKPQTESKRGSWIFAGTAGVVILAVGLWFANRPQPQMTFDEDVFNTVDALFTAVTSRNSQRLADCDARLSRYREEGRLGDSAATALTGIVDQARGGEWDSAGKRLYAFILGQRRAS